MWKSITGRITMIVVLTTVAIIFLVPSLTDRFPAEFGRASCGERVLLWVGAG